MSGPVFVTNADGTPLMPMSAAYARRLLQSSKAIRLAHHAFTILRLTQAVTEPMLRAVTLQIHVDLDTAELLLSADSRRGPLPLFRLIIDLRTDLGWRMRRRAAHRRRRRLRGRYRAGRRYRRPFKLKRPSLRSSVWSRLLHRPLGQRRRRLPGHVPALIRWRAQAIERVITMLQRWVPISRVVLAPAPHHRTLEGADTGETLRERLIAAYGHVGADGKRHPMCAYCGTTDRTIVVDHLLPRSRGGTDAWHNVVLACQVCNDKKGARTPAEAGMALLIPVPAEPVAAQRAQPYVRQTLRVLTSTLLNSGMTVERQAQGDELHTEAPEQTGTDRRRKTAANVPSFVAEPLSRPRKQQFTARNYPLAVAPQPPYVRFRATVKRRVRPNRALAVWEEDGRLRTRVLTAADANPPGAQLVTIGTLCAARRGTQDVVGIVAAIHSSGRLTLRLPGRTTAQRVMWERVVVSPRQHLRILSTDRVIFLPVTTEAPMSNDQAS